MTGEFATQRSVCLVPAVLSVAKGRDKAMPMRPGVRCLYSLALGLSGFTTGCQELDR